MTDRIAQIKGLLQRSPQDVFLNYSLAMELWSAGRRDEALAQFEQTAQVGPDYLPALVEWGKALRSAGRATQARAVLGRALELAGRLSEAHTADYIRQQLEGLAPR